MVFRASRDYGSILLGSAGEGRPRRRIRIQVLLTFALVGANLFGALVAGLLMGVGIPEPPIFRLELWWANFIVVPLYVVFAFVVGIWVCTVISVRALRWSIRGRIPTEGDARRTNALPRRLAAIQATLWLVGTVLLTVVYGIIDPELIPKVAFVTGLSGIVVVAAAVLLIGFTMRPVAAELISAGYGRRRRSGLTARTVMAWITGSAIPFVGILLVGLFGVTRDETSKHELFIGVMVLVVVGLITGMALTVLMSLSITGPIASVRTALDRVQKGDLDGATMVVYDGTELGDLQVGFNAMTSGLRERERMRDLFGRHVGHDVAAAALVGDPELGGVERWAATVFVDVIGSTTLAQDHSATEVVGILNDFFAVIVRAVEDHDGLVNKFEGDAVLAIFGAPITLHDPAGAALSAAREIAARLPSAVPDLQAGIGVSYGLVVAGNVGAIERFEYTVIGDAVNESARLSELAKRDPRRPLASARAIAAAAGGIEIERWERQETLTLRGRTEVTEVYCARDEVPAPAETHIDGASGADVR